MSLFDELKRRKVLQTAAIYVAIAWGATEIIVTIADKFTLPESVSQITLIAFITGFPVAMFASWFVDISAAGFRTTTPGKPLGAKSAVVLVGITIGATFLLWSLIRPPGPGVDQCPATDPFCATTASLAVLPFTNLTGDDSNDFVASGLSEDLVVLLAHLEKLRIAASRSSSIAAGQNLSIADIGQALGVENILEGRLQSHGAGLQIVAQLIDARSQFIYWTQRFRVETSLLDVREAISLAVAEALEFDLASDDHGALLRPTQSPEAYEAYLRGLQEARINGYGASEPLQYFMAAVKLDPEFADAYAALADTLVAMSNESGDSLDKARAAAERALELNPRLSQGYVVLGLLRRRATDTGGAADALLRALELNPNDESAHLNFGQLLANQGLLNAANREYEIAYSLDPLNQLLDVYRLDVLVRRGEVTKAISALQEHLLADPDSTLIYGNLQIITLLIGEAERAVEYAAEATSANAATGWNFGLKSMAETRLGRTAAAWDSIYLGEQVRSRNIFVRTAKFIRLAADGNGAGLADTAQKIIEESGANRHFRKWAGLGALMNGDYLSSIGYLEAAFENQAWFASMFPAEEIVHMANLVPAYRGIGEQEKADQWLSRGLERVQHLREQKVSLPDLDYAEGALLVLQGDHEKGLDMLEQAAMRGWLGWPIMRHDPKLQVLIGNARFDAIIAGPQS